MIDKKVWFMRKGNEAGSRHMFTFLLRAFPLTVRVACRSVRQTIGGASKT